MWLKISFTSAGIYENFVFGFWSYVFIIFLVSVNQMRAIKEELGDNFNSNISLNFYSEISFVHAMCGLLEGFLWLMHVKIHFHGF